MIKICVICQESFNATGSMKTCSLNCFNINKKNKEKESYKRNYKKITPDIKNCLICNNSFSPYKFQKYCSMKCFRQSNKRKEYLREYQKIWNANPRRKEYLRNYWKTEKYINYVQNKNAEKSASEMLQIMSLGTL